MGNEGQRQTFFHKLSLSNFNSLWSSAQSKLPTIIFNYSFKYIHSSLQKHTNLHKWMSYHLHLSVLSAWHKNLLYTSFLVAKFIFNRASILCDTILSSCLKPKPFNLSTRKDFCQHPWIYQLFCCHRRRFAA